MTQQLLKVFAIALLAFTVGGFVGFIISGNQQRVGELERELHTLRKDHVQAQKDALDLGRYRNHVEVLSRELTEANRVCFAGGDASRLSDLWSQTIR